MLYRGFRATNIGPSSLMFQWLFSIAQLACRQRGRESAVAKRNISTSLKSGVRPAYRAGPVPVPISRMWYAAGARSDSSEGWHRRFLLDGFFRPQRTSAWHVQREATQYRAVVLHGAALS